VRLYLIAFQFLTIIPLKIGIRWQNERDLGRSMSLFPLVGLTLGGMIAGLDFFLSPRLPAGLAAALLLIALTAVTGALHLDGVADVFDGLAARGDRNRFLAVMKDSRTGAVGVTALILLLLVKWQAIVAIPASFRWQALVLAPGLGRLAMVGVAALAKRARAEGLGAACIAGTGWGQLMTATLLAAAASVTLLGRYGAFCLALVFCISYAIRAYFHHRLGGVTGDIIGAAGELSETAVLALMTTFEALQ
jgi:adenosylcobinamide-GDP ribazoletransferase